MCHGIFEVSSHYSALSNHCNDINGLYDYQTNFKWTFYLFHSINYTFFGLHIFLFVDLSQSKIFVSPPDNFSSATTIPNKIFLGYPLHLPSQYLRIFYRFSYINVSMVSFQPTTINFSPFLPKTDLRGGLE